MRFMILLKANATTEAGVLPDEKLLTAMGKYNEDLIKAGVLLDGAGLQPSKKGARVQFSGAKRTVAAGPFADASHLVSGFWMFQVKSKEEAIEWVKRCPNPVGEGEAQIEIRQVFEASDFGPEAAAREQALCEAQAKSSAVKAIPDGAHTIVARLVVSDGARAMDFYQRAFGAEERTRALGPDGKIIHGELKIGDSLLYVCDGFGPSSPPSGVTVNLWTAQPDVLFARALEAGAQAKMPLTDMFWGARYGELVDPFGHTWALTKQLEELTPSEIQERSQAFFAKMCAAQTSS